MATERVDLEEAVKGDRRGALEAMRDYIAHELEANLCQTCLNSRLRTGDQASLLLRLDQVLKELDVMPVNDGRVSDLNSIRNRRGGAPDPLGSKGAKRKQGGRRRGLAEGGTA